MPDKTSLVVLALYWQTLGRSIQLTGASMAAPQDSLCHRRGFQCSKSQMSIHAKHSLEMRIPFLALTPSIHPTLLNSSLAANYRENMPNTSFFPLIRNTTSLRHQKQMSQHYFTADVCTRNDTLINLMQYKSTDYLSWLTIKLRKHSITIRGNSLFIDFA